MRHDFYWANRSKETPNYLYKFYIELGHWKCMDKDNMINKLRKRIIPGVCEERAENARNILKQIQSS